MAVCVEANSLSDITQIASNPPRFPRNPACTPRESLTLYIARVPGTKDIILTTLRPLTTNVTAEDVTTCLYYLHVNSDKDSQLLERKSPNSPRRLFESNSPVSTRKPPLTKPLNVSNENIKINTASTSLNRRTHSIKRKPLPGYAPSVDSQTLSQADEIDCLQPLAPPLTSSAVTVERKPLPGTEKNQSLQRETIFRPVSHTAQSYDHHEDIPSSCVESERPEEKFHVTLVRRDPSSGAQWNVGTIFGHPVIEETKSNRQYSRISRKPYYDMTLSLTTPGYTHFRNQTPVYDNSQPGAPNFIKPEIQSPGYSFDRKLMMEGSSFWSRASAQRKRAMSDFSEKYGKSIGTKSPEKSDHPPDLKEHQGKGYIFTSPWGGRCKFLTGSGGRSLRCLHTLPSPISANPTEIQQQPVIVSELRFNLPVSVLAYSTSSQGPYENSRVFSESKYSNIRNKINGLKLSRPPLTLRSKSVLSCNGQSGDEEELIHTQSRKSALHTDEDKSQKTHTSRESSELKRNNSRGQGLSHDSVDLGIGIGREKAGGGNKGKRAKLGKIIIHDEGLKMLDLIISANMAVWWSVWEF